MDDILENFLSGVLTYVELIFKAGEQSPEGLNLWIL
jgi:hypothetical protein